MENTNIDERKNAWLEKRRGYITGTDAAGLLGISKWTNPFRIWLEKRGETEPVAENEAMRWGLKLEPKILEAYAEANPTNDFVRCDGYALVTSDEFPRLAASLDGWNRTLNCPVDAKNIRIAGAEWGDAGTDEFPDYYKAQLSVQMAVTGARMAQLAVLFSGQDFRIYNYSRDDELIARISAAAEEFWKRHMDGDEEPTLGGDEASTKWVKEHLSTAEKGKTVEPDKDTVEAVVKLKLKKAQLKEVETEVAELENRVKGFMGDAEVCTGLCTWKNNKDSESTDWKKVASAFEGKEGYEEAVKAATTTKPGARVLRITLK